MLLLKGRISMTVATNTASYGSLVFEGIGNHYVMIAVVFFLLGIPAGLGVDALIRRWKRRRIDRYAQKWMGRENASRSSCDAEPKRWDRLLRRFPHLCLPGGLPRIAFLLKKRYDETGAGFFAAQGRKQSGGALWNAI